MISSIHPIPAFSDNYIWVISEDGSNNACVVDPGDATPVISYLQENNLNLTDILITHHHPDHTGGIKELVAIFSPRVIGPSSSNIQGISEAVKEGDRITLFSQEFEVLEVPGHTLDHLAFHCVGHYADHLTDSPPILFCGDTLFAAGCGRLFEGTAEMMHKSLGKLTALSLNTQIYCTHEYTMANLKFAIAADPHNQALKSRIEIEQEKRNTDTPTLPSSVDLELATNPFLRCSDPAVIQTASNHFANSPQNEVEVFAALRSWKDNF